MTEMIFYCAPCQYFISRWLRDLKKNRDANLQQINLVEFLLIFHFEMQESGTIFSARK